jgi:hypothetical protein
MFTNRATALIPKSQLVSLRFMSAPGSSAWYIEELDTINKPVDGPRPAPTLNIPSKIEPGKN